MIAEKLNRARSPRRAAVGRRGVRDPFPAMPDRAPARRWNPATATSMRPPSTWSRTPCRPAAARRDGRARQILEPDFSQSSRNFLRPMSVSGCLMSICSTLNGMVATWAPALAASMTWIGLRMDAASTCVLYP